jgi:predicted RNase H-like nuclease (RuvC/YqgF family)
MNYTLDGKGGIWLTDDAHSEAEPTLFWNGNAAEVVRFLRQRDSLQRAVNGMQAENAELRQEIARLRGLVETGKQAAVQALTLFQENEGLRHELRKHNGHA